MKIIAVQFQDKETPGEFGGREYTYYAAVELTVGDVIVAPTRNGMGVVRVSRTDMAESEVDERLIPYMRTIETLIRPDEVEVLQ